MTRTCSASSSISNGIRPSARTVSAGSHDGPSATRDGSNDRRDSSHCSAPRGPAAPARPSPTQRAAARAPSRGRDSRCDFERGLRSASVTALGDATARRDAAAAGRRDAAGTGWAARPGPGAPSLHARRANSTSAVQRMPAAHRGGQALGRQRPHEASAHLGTGVLRSSLSSSRCSRTSPSDDLFGRRDVLHASGRAPPRAAIRLTCARRVPGFARPLQPAAHLERHASAGRSSVVLVSSDSAAPDARRVPSALHRLCPMLTQMHDDEQSFDRQHEAPPAQSTSGIRHCSLLITYASMDRARSTGSLSRVIRTP